MSSNIEEHVKILREQRIAKEQARFQKLRELNMKKYPKDKLTSNVTNRPVPEIKITNASHTKTVATSKNVQVNGNKNIQRNSHANCSKRPVTVPVVKRPDYTNIKPKVVTKFVTKSDTKVEAKSSNRHLTVKSKSATVTGAVKKSSTKNMNSDNVTVGGILKSATKVMKNINNKPSTSKFDMTKPDIIITEATDNEAGSIASNAQKSDTKITGTKNSENENTSNKMISRPDIIITTQKHAIRSANDKKVLTEITKKVTVSSKLFPKNDVKSRKSYAPSSSNHINKIDNPKINARKSMLPKLVEGTKSESVFDRLYKPKGTKKTSEIIISDAEKLRTDPNYLKRVVNNANLIFNMHQKVKTEERFPQRRSISAVHFKRIRKSEASNCIHKWGSIGDKLDKVNLHEDIGVKNDKVTSAIKSERKKVQFLTPGFSSFNTPRPDELQARLKSWLQKRGKSLTSYHHLQCFGLNNSKTDFGTPKSMSSITYEDAMQSPYIDDENKENIALESDSDDGSYSEIMNEPKEALTSVNKIDTTNWRNVSMVSESVYNESNISQQTNDITLTPANSVRNVDDLLHGALNDLSTLLQEGFDWQQAARWLRSIRSRFPEAPRTAAYWECRAALEDLRGNLTASLECWNEAIAKGSEESKVDANLDQLLNKFMQLKISPHSGATRQADRKLVDVKNVFKSTIIKFAVQQAKLRNQSEAPTPMFTVTPVRRSARLTQRISRTPLQLCDTVRQAATLVPEHVFTHNDNFVETP